MFEGLPVGLRQLLLWLCWPSPPFALLLCPSRLLRILCKLRVQSLSSPPLTPSLSYSVPAVGVLSSPYDAQSDDYASVRDVRHLEDEISKFLVWRAAACPTSPFGRHAVV
jgi:hypothetical protein